MQSDQQVFPQSSLFPLSNNVGGSYLHNAPKASSFGGTVLPTTVKHSRPFHGVEFQPSEVCPKNFIIFDQTENRSQVMFHPVIAPKLCFPPLNIRGSYIPHNVEREPNIEKEPPSPLVEDSDDIDALLSLEEDECDEEEISTGRTQGNYDSDSSDSGSSSGSIAKKSKLPRSFHKSAGSGNSCNSERKRLKMKKMMKALRRIVPGGNQMSTATVFDEAVKYLKSLKVEAQKLEVSNLK